uniref:Uncharacterized protein n=1 Tax=Nicotiana tabacum TaxID=4097 RepID=A0A1S4CVQ2_TOBAC|nr:PREDICTED: uncharacterized protein LOC107823117 [Nicotiana tabacum]
MRYGDRMCMFCPLGEEQQMRLFGCIYDIVGTVTRRRCGPGTLRDFLQVHTWDRRFLNTSSTSLRGILETNKLVGPNFDDWYVNLRIVLMHEKLIDVIDKHAKEVPDEDDDDDATKIYQKYLEECLTTKCIILASMSSELQKKHQNIDLTAILEHLKKIFDTQSRTARYQLSKDLFVSKLTGNSLVGHYVNHMINLIEELEKLGCKLGKEISQDLILQPLSESFSQFVINFNMHKMDCDLHEMLNILIDYENQIASEKK